MKLNFFFILTLIMFLLLASHVFVWIDHQKAHQDEECECASFIGEEWIMGVGLLLGAFLLSISLLAYYRDKNKKFLLISLAYLIVMIHCVFWFIGAYFASGELVHTLTHEFDLILLLPAVLLILLAVYKRGA